MMNEKLRKRAAVAGLCLLLAVGLVSVVKDTQACPANEVETDYYSNAAHTTLVGQSHLQCFCAGFTHWGQATVYSSRFVSSCAE